MSFNVMVWIPEDRRAEKHNTYANLEHANKIANEFKESPTAKKYSCVIWVEMTNDPLTIETDLV